MKHLEALCGCEKSRILRQNWRNCRTSVQDGLTNHWTRHTDWLISVHRYQQPYHSPKVITRTVTRNSLVLNLDRWRQWCGTRQVMLDIPGGHLWLKNSYFQPNCVFCGSEGKKSKKGKTWTSEPLSNLNLMVEYSFVQLQHWCWHSCAHDIWTPFI